MEFVHARRSRRIFAGMRHAAMIMMLVLSLGCQDSEKPKTAAPDTARLKPAKRERCQAITRKGTRCKRDAQQGSIYCWQHKRLKEAK